MVILRIALSCIFLMAFEFFLIDCNFYLCIDTNFLSDIRC